MSQAAPLASGSPIGRIAPASKQTQIVSLSNCLKVFAETRDSPENRERIIFVNGALATSTSFDHVIRHLSKHFNTLSFDLPYAGRSRPYNPANFVLTFEDEIEILHQLIDRFSPKFLLSMSWGGVSSLLTLARYATGIDRAIICSFSPILNSAMKDFIVGGRDFIGAGNLLEGARLLNETIGEFLPTIVKQLNYRYLSRLSENQQRQLAFHVDQVLHINATRLTGEVCNITSRVKFLNGALDKYTTAADVKELAAKIRSAEAEIIPGAGHFLGAEGPRQHYDSVKAIAGFFSQI